MFIILYPTTPSEISFQVNDAGIHLGVHSQDGDTCFIGLNDDVVGYVIEQLIHYAWDMTVEEAFADNPSETLVEEVDDDF